MNPGLAPTGVAAASPSYISPIASGGQIGRRRRPHTGPDRQTVTRFFLQLNIQNAEFMQTDTQKKRAKPVYCMSCSQVMLSHGCQKELPPVLDRSYVYLSTLQRDPLMRIEHDKEFVNTVAGFLPCWVPHRTLAAAMGIPPDAIERAELSFGFYAWATEFENVHSMWNFQEPTLTIDGMTYNDSEHYYQSQKPVPWDMATWEAMKVDVMTKAVWEKVLRSEDVRLLLLSTREHPLVSIKTDYFWGFHPSNKEVSVNALAVILMSIRTALRRVCGEVSGRVRQEISCC